MGWEQRGAYSYYYKKEREGSRVKSIYVGRGQIANMIAEIQSSSPLLERVARTIKSPEAAKAEKAEATLQQVSDLIQLITQASLLSAGFHTHHRQWRRKRSLIGKKETGKHESHITGQPERR
jgi:transposase